MFRIGEFSQFSRVSVKMLRHYDRLGLLRPAYVDPFTHYRYYSADQLPRLQRLLALKDLGFSLEQVQMLLDEQLTTEQMRGMLKRRRAELKSELNRQQLQLARVQARLAELEGPAAPEGPRYDVVLRGVEAETVAAIRQKVAAGATAGALFEELEGYVARFQARAPRPPLLLYHDTAYEEEAADVEVAVPVREPVPATERVRLRTLAAQEQMACVIHTGGYETLTQALASLLAWIEHHDYAITGPIREAYLRFGADQDGYRLPDVYLAASAAEFVTELQVPVARP